MSKHKCDDEIDENTNVQNIKKVKHEHNKSVTLLEIIIELKDLEIKSKKEYIIQLEHMDANKNERIFELVQINAEKDRKIKELEVNYKCQVQITCNAQKKMYLASTVIARFLESI